MTRFDPTKVLLHVNDVHDGLPLCDGVHYAVKGSLTPQQVSELHAEIVHRLDAALSDQFVPAGLIRGVLLPISSIQNIPVEDRDILYDRGVNPIVMRNGAPILWGNHFVFQGHIYRMFGMFRNEPSVHPYLSYLLMAAPASLDYLNITREIVESARTET